MIRHESRDGVNLVRFDRPDKKNAITGEMYLALVDGLMAGEADSAIGCHLICGSPGAFTAGNDIADFMRFASQGDLSDTPVLKFLSVLARLEKPLVAAVDGLAIGVGTTLLFHCDMVYATPRTVLRTPFVDLGLVPEAGSSLLAPRIMGHQRAFALLCLGDAFTAEAAREAGIVNHVVNEADLETAAFDCASRIAARPREAMALSRRLLRGDRTEVLARMDEEALIFGQRLSSPEAATAFAAFMGKAKG
ncbi:crotonase/enoyl-CoA hydratase family protein [Pannonibacter sp. Pt2]|uniref:Crotonase/enoyl-CoA hydratase family protein n=1 Tax=Pannonibacter anstelovis TaxID=3121537 RepID=A0ABU7ZJL3_9HYPH